MFTDKRLLIVAPLVLATVTLAWTCTLLAQVAPVPSTSAPSGTASAPAGTKAAEAVIEVGDKNLADLWGEFMHYIGLARSDMALSYGKAILARNPKPEDVYLLSVKYANAQKRLNEASAQSPALKDVVNKVRDLIEQGYQADRSNPTQIDRSIADLSGGMRQYENAAQRLVISGEFALPQMIQKLSAADTPGELKLRIRNVLIRMGKEAVNGLCAVLASNNAELQETVAGVLAQIGYKQAAPFLKELEQRKGIMDRTRAAVASALVTLVGKDSANKSVAELSYEYAQKFYNNDESLMPDARMPKANVWYWQEGLGLVYKAVPRAIFADIYAMRLSKTALENESKFDQAMALWLAADFRREANLPQGIKDPTEPEGMPSARFFALSSPPEILQDVLSRGLKAKDNNVAFGAIDALVKTQGAKSLVQPVAGGAQPLVEAMSYSDASIRYSAALALAEAMPEKSFSGSDVVLTAVNEALRMSGKKVALLVVADEKARNEYKDVLRGEGFDVIDEPDQDKAMAQAKAAPGLDLAVFDAASASDLTTAMRKEATYVSTQVIVGSEDPKVVGKLKGDSLVTFLAPGAKLQDVLGKLFGKNPQSMPADQATNWIIRMSESVRMLALTNNSVYNLARVRPALIQNLSSQSTEVQIASAKALAAMSAADAQQAIANLALKGDIAEKIRVDMLGILTESVRRFGNQLTEQQATALYAIVSGAATPTVREAAAQAWGSLNLPSERSKALILQFGPKS